MKKDKLRLYLIEIFLLIVLFLALFVSNKFNKKLLALVLVAITGLVCYFIKRKRPSSIYQTQVVWLMAGFGVIYLGIFYLMGLYFGYYKSPTPFGLRTIYNFILPFTAIVISSEILRKRLIVQKGKASRIITFIAMVLIDLIIYTGVYDLRRLDDMLAAIGFILFASIACNLLYNYMTIRFGPKSIIVFRLMTILYAYFIPYIPNIYIFFRSFLRIVYPYIIYLVLEYTYGKTNYATAYSDRKKNIIYTTILCIVMTLLIALISCKFRFGIIVVGSGSMTGSLDKGDAVIFEQYKGEPIKTGTIIIYQNEDIQTVHRVVSVENVNGEYRYYTKGDMNPDKDPGYRLKDDMVGVVKFKIPYIGYPTLWLRDIFS